MALQQEELQNNDLLGLYLRHVFGGTAPKRHRLLCEARSTGRLVVFVDGLERASASASSASASRPASVSAVDDVVEVDDSTASRLHRYIVEELGAPIGAAAATGAGAGA